MDFVIETQKRRPAAAFVAQAEAGAAQTKPANLGPQELKNAIVQSIDDDKGEDIIVVDLHDKSNIADFVVIASGRSSRQVGSMADHLVQRLQASLSYRIAIEGLPQADWVLIDCGDVIVHLFRPEVRDFYAIEKMWGLEPPKMPSPETSFGETPFPDMLAGEEPEAQAQI